MAEQEHTLGAMPVRRLLIHMSWPIMLSMFVQALYNLADSIFVARINEAAFLALSFAFPVQNFMVAVCLGTGVGVNAMLSRRLGEKHPEAAVSVAQNGFLVYLCCWMVFLAFGATAPAAYLSFFTGDALTLGYGQQYLSIVCCGSVGMCMEFACERVLQSSGHPIGHLAVQGIGVVFNLIFDPILIFGLLGFPKLGVAGAAIATVGGQVTGMCVGLVLISRLKELPCRLRGFRPDLRTIADIYRIGFPAIVAQSLVTFMTMGMNKILGLFSSTLIVVLNYYFKLQTFIFMPVYGLSNGLVPVVGYNYGSGSRKRILFTIRFALFLALGIMIPGMLLMLVFPGALLSLFQPETAAYLMGIPALRVISLSFPFASVSMTLSASFQAMGSPLSSLLVSVTRQLLMVLPCLWVLALIDPSLVWWSIPVSEAAGMVLSLVLYRNLYRTKIQKLDGSKDVLGGTIV